MKLIFETVSEGGRNVKIYKHSNGSLGIEIKDAEYDETLDAVLDRIDTQKLRHIIFKEFASENSIWTMNNKGEVTQTRTKEQEFQEFCNCLNDIAIDAGDNRDGSGSYTSDRIRNLIKEFKKKYENGR